MDLTPRPAEAAPRRRRRPWAAFLVLVAVLVAGGVVVTKFLTSAIDYYCNVDEIGQKSGCDAGRRLRIQGTVEEGTVTRQAGVTRFVISFNGVSVPVRYQGEPGGIFQECIPVVVHGRLTAPLADGGVFDGDRVEVRHSNEYEAENKDRVDQAESAACSPRA